MLMDEKVFQQFEEFIHSRSVAIIGESATSEFYWLRSFRNFGFPGKIYPINPKYEEADGMKFYKSLRDIPGPVDYAILRVPAHIVPSVVDECIGRGVKCVTIFASGFSELGTEEGRRLEAQVEEKLRANKMRAFGPNCMGLTCPETRFAFRPDFTPNPGPVGFVSQSGGKAIDTYLALTEAGVGCSKAFSYGNECDITSYELIEYLHRDPKTRVIGMYVEGAKHGTKLRASLAAAAAEKPVVVWKAGTTDAGARAAASHSAALAGATQIWDGLLKQTGVAVAHCFEDLMDGMVSFVRCPRPRGSRVALVEISGGAGVAATDVLASEGFTLPRLDRKTVDALASIVETVGTNIRNPIDLATSYFYPDITAEALRLVSADSNIDAVILEAAPHYVSFMEKHLGMADYALKYWDQMIEAIAYCTRKLHKPFLTAFPAISYAEENLAARRQFRKAGLPVYFTTANAASTLRMLIDYYARHHDVRAPSGL
jgi:acyl-CoA synthetase (NDP forming)